MQYPPPQRPRVLEIRLLRSTALRALGKSSRESGPSSAFPGQCQGNVLTLLPVPPALILSQTEFWFVVVGLHPKNPWLQMGR